MKRRTLLAGLAAISGAAVTGAAIAGGPGDVMAAPAEPKEFIVGPHPLTCDVAVLHSRDRGVTFDLNNGAFRICSSAGERFNSDFDYTEHHPVIVDWWDRIAVEEGKRLRREEI